MQETLESQGQVRFRETAFQIKVNTMGETLKEGKAKMGIIAKDRQLISETVQAFESSFTFYSSPVAGLL